MPDDSLETVRFSGGTHHGLVVQAPPGIAARLHDMDFEVTAAGGLFDRIEQVRIRGVRVVARPGETPPPPVLKRPVVVDPVLDFTAPPPTPRRSRPAPAVGPLFRTPSR